MREKKIDNWRYAEILQALCKMLGGNYYIMHKGIIVMLVIINCVQHNSQ